MAKLAKNSRAAAGGGKATPLNPNSMVTSQIGMTYGASGEGAAWFGPGQPMTPQAPEEVKGRAFDFPQGYNLLNTTRAYEPISYATLRAFADGYDLLRLIIETRKDAMERLKWNIQLRDPKEKMTPQKKNRINAITKFFMKPDGENNWNTWLRMILEDLFVVDAATLHRRRTRGGRLISLDQIDGATIRRVLDNWGRTPEGPTDTCYQQILKGMPAVNYLKKDLLFKPRNKRIHKVYGYSPVEQIMMTINIGLRRQIFQLNFFTEGNVPASLIGVPETWTPDQIRTFQEWFDNILVGNLAERRKARFVPSAVGKTYIPTQETQLFGEAEDWLARVCCFAFSINPQPFIKMMNRATSQNASEESSATGLQPIQAWVKDNIDEVICDDFDSPDLEFVWRGDDILDPEKRQKITSGYLADGLITVNEGRAESGREPYDNPIFDEPLFQTSNGFAPIDSILQGSGGNPGSNPQGGGNPNTFDDDPNNNPDANEPVDKKIQKFVTAGDEKGLADFLRQFEQGAAQ